MLSTFTYQYHCVYCRGHTEMETGEFDKKAAESRLESLTQERDAYVARVFMLIIKIIAIFLIPALIAVLLIWHFGKEITWYVLPVSFIFSWSIVIMLYRKISKKMKQLDQELKEAREALNLGPMTSQVK